jgi:pimeloyl-ACP methyl ester carboxylesterase
VVVFQHGTGGNYRGFCDDDDLLEVANRLGEEAIVGVGIDQPLHGSRPGSDEANDLAHFNIINPDSGVTNFRQGALDAIYLARALARRSWTLSGSGLAVRTDPERVMFMGHSQGGLTGALAAPFFAGDVQASMISGAGGVLAITVVERKDPLDFAALVRGLLQLDEAEELTPLHPTLGLVQTLVEVTDPVNYAPYWFAEPGGWVNHVPAPVLLTNGTLDAATPYQTAIALASAARLPQIGDPATRCDAVRMRTGPPQALPRSGNAAMFDGRTTAAGFAQFLDGTHFVVFEEEPAADLTYGWLRSVADGAPLLEMAAP